MILQIPIVSAEEASKLALLYKNQGFQTLKLKVGKKLDADIEVLQAIRKVYPGCDFILDANEGYTSKEAVEVLHKLHGNSYLLCLFVLMVNLYIFCLFFIFELCII